MKTLKILLTVLITLVIVVAGFATEMLAAADITVLNPRFYKSALDEMGFYENLRVLLINQMKYYVDQQDLIPEELKQDAYDVAETVLAKKKFSNEVGEFLGGTAEYIIRGKGDAIIPLQGWIEGFDIEVVESGLVEDVMDYDIKNGDLAESDRDAYFDAYKNVISSTYTGYLVIYTSFLSGSDKLSDLIKIFAPTEELQNKIEARFWIIRYWVNRANIAAYVGLGLVLLMTALLFIVWKKNVGVVFKIIGIILIVNSAIFILMGIGLLLSLTIAGLLNAIPAFLLPYLNIVQSLINPLAMVALGTGIIVLVLGIILAVIGGALIRKKADMQPTEVPLAPAPEVSEIEYPTKPAEPAVELISEEETAEEKAEEGPSEENNEEK